MISNVGTGFVGDDDELLCICWRGVVLDIRIEESPVDTWYLKPWKAVRLFRGGNGLIQTLGILTLRGGSGNDLEKCEEFENQENVLTCKLRGSRISRRVEGD